MRFDSLGRSAGIGIAAAVVAVVIVYLIADGVSGPLLAEQPGSDGPEEVPLAGAIVATVIGGLVGTALAYLTARTSRPVEIFAGVAMVGLVVYGILALVAADEASTGIWLNVMHVTAAIPIVGSMVRWLQGREPIPA